jgi:hypothetical protein
VLLATISPVANQTTWIHVADTSPPVFVGPSGVTTSNGLLCGGGSDVRLQRSYNVGTTAAFAVYGICAGPYSGTVKVSTTTS